jgi:CrcB protein
MLGGALACGARHLINVGFGRWLGSGFAWAKRTVNVGGCLLMGLVVEALALEVKGALDLRPLIATGILGGFTTVSAYALHFAGLVGQQARVAAGLYRVGSVVPSLAALSTGSWLTRWTFT